MDLEESWRAITAQRLSLADLLEGLTDPQWDTPSLCEGWRVRDVAAHLAMAPQVPSLTSMLADAVRARGSFDRLNHTSPSGTPPGPSPRSSPNSGNTQAPDDSPW